MRKYLITGCAGFIGSHTMDLFVQNGHEVVGYDALTYAAKNHSRYQGKLVVGQIEDTEHVMQVCQDEKIDRILNFAAETHVDNSIFDSSHFMQSNVLGVVSLLNVSRALNIPLLQVSTDEVYGPCKRGSFYEDDKLSPKNPYSASKAAGDHMIGAWHNTYGVQYLIFRPSNNFGPRQHEEKFMPHIMKALHQPDPADRIINVYGDGLQQREWLYVKKTAEAIYHIAEKTNSMNEIFNVGSGISATNIEIVKIICSLMHMDWKKCVRFVADRPGHDVRYSINSRKLNSTGYDFLLPALKVQLETYLSEWEADNVVSVCQ